ncbi:MAG: DoxX family protein [Alphaproteobacteria bacterium]|nr:MAG: DoxX family protein [Alphaproteobacteria bacterium]
MIAFVTVFYDWSRAVASGFTWLAPLAVRIAVGVVFMGTGWTKLHNLPAITKNFASLGIPAPEILTPFVSGVEFVGALLLLVGLLTRLAAVPLMVVMVVAIVSAKAGDIDSLETVLGFEEVSYFLMFAWLAIAGPGPVSLDHFVLKASGRDPEAHGA